MPHSLPWTHQTYRLLSSEWLRFLNTNNPYGGIAAGFIDAAFALTVLFLILFFQIPRRKVAAKVD